MEHLIGTQYTITYEQRPFTMNEVRRMNHFAHAKLVKEWRTAFGVLVRRQQIPPLDEVAIEIWHHRKTRRKVDLGACYPAAKAAIDSLVDCNVLPDDDPDHVVRLSFHRPFVDGRDALSLQLTVIKPAERVVA